jgi:hypothetical protein
MLCLELRGDNEAARVHHSYRRRGRSVAALRKRPTVSDSCVGSDLDR